MAAKISTSISRRMPEDMARVYIEDFRDQYGEAHYHFAQHAAFPLALTADLLYHLRESFQRTTSGEKFDIPWIAIADILLSPLCEEVDIGYELYEMDVSIRTQLLKDLQANPLFGAKRIDELALFLRNYVEKQLPGSDSVTRDLVQSQTWTALAYLKPDQVAQELAKQIKNLYIKGSIEQVRITSILETLQALDTPLATLKGFQPLLTYSQVQAHSLLGHQPAVGATDLIKQTTREVAESLNIDLPLDREEVQRERSSRIQQTISTQSDFYISHHTADHDWVEWIAKQLQNAGYTVTWSFEYGPTNSLDIDADTSYLRNQARYTIALLSQEYMSIDNVRKEWTAILARDQQQEQRSLLPIRVRECTPQGIFASIQYLDLVGQNRDTAQEMLLNLIHQSLSERIGPPAAQDTDRAADEKASTEFIKIFISYAHQDEEFSDELQRYLSILRKQYSIQVWDYRMVLAGVNWRNEVLKNLSNSDIVLFLISADFFASNFSSGIEIQRAMQLHNLGVTRLIPIILRPVNWQETPLGQFVALPRNMVAITRWQNRDEAFKDIIKDLEDVIEEFIASKLLPIDENERRVQELERKARVNQDAGAYADLGSLYERLRRVEDAIRAYEAARSLQPENGDVLFTLSRLYNDTGAYEQAIALLDRLIELQPKFADAYKQRGLAYRRRADAEYATTGDGERRTDEYKQAIADFERAVELRPDFEDALGTLGGLYRRLGDYEQAAKYYQRLYEVNPSSSYGLGNLASLSWYLGNIDDARKYFNLLEAAARVRIKEGEGEEAGQKRAQDNEAYWNYYDLALGQLATGELDAVRETYAKAIEETPTIAPLDAVLSNLYFLQRAREHIEGLEEIIAMIENAKDVKAAGDA